MLWFIVDTNYFIGNKIEKENFIGHPELKKTVPNKKSIVIHSKWDHPNKQRGFDDRNIHIEYINSI